VFKNLKIQFKISVLLIVLLMVSVAFNAAWSSTSQIRQAEKEMLEKTQILDQEMRAVWDFIDINQHRIDTDSNGEYNFKNIYCAIAGKSVAKLFMQQNDYEIRYVSFTPRYSSAYPDEFEAVALNEFNRSTGIVEYYDITTFSDRDVFRYASPIRVKESCLSCHGEPAGELDVTGHAKEGLKVGDLAGAMSIIMPIDLYMENINTNILQQSVSFFLISAATIAIVYAAISLVVTRPLRRMEKTIEQMESGNLNISFDGTGSSGEIRDLERKFQSMAQQLRSLYNNLEGEVDDRTHQLAEANRVLDEQRINLERANEMLKNENQYKSDFLATMSHEFRTPLTAILAIADIWEHSSAFMSERDADTVKELKENGTILLNMVNNILEVARIDAGRIEMDYEFVDMVDLISIVESATRPLAERRDIKFTTVVAPDVPLIRADWEKLRRIVENLTSNAIKFTKRGGEVSISVRYEVVDDGRIAIAVSDTGIGIKAEDIPLVFEKFVQLDKSAFRRYNGSGLGLTVVKDLAEAHQGTIEVVSEFKQGSTFTVRIPVNNEGDVDDTDDVGDTGNTGAEGAEGDADDTEAT
jgi:signal transduction histidine kinase